MLFRTVLGALLLACGWECAARAECDRSPLLVRNVTVWTGTKLVEGRDVLIRDGRVVEVARRIDSGKAARTIDGAGDTLLPGLLDLHLHFVIPGLPQTVRDFEVSGRQLLRYGVTGGRLHLATLEQAAELRRLGMDDCVAVPRIQAGGPALGGGAPDADFPVYKGVRSAEDARSKVEKMADRGMQWVAVHDIHKFSEAERKALFAAAGQRRLRVFAAAMSPEELREALRWPVHTVDYIDRTEAAGYTDELLRGLRRRRRTVAAVPTIGIFAWYAALKSGSASLDDAYLYEFLSDAEAEQVRATARRDLQQDKYVSASARFAPTLPRKLRELVDIGVPMALGTDVGSPAQLHAGAMWREMEAWRSYGAPRETVLRAATRGGAEILGEREMGRIEKGARGDFVLYRGRVMEGAFEAGRVRAVAKGGVLLVSEGKWVGPRL
ncbi:MAG: amidohydrolase family protein [Bryobacteraceae bacterium]|nr:amidohydrolase family protein [Bryobacteraceae bacterium]